MFFVLFKDFTFSISFLVIGGILLLMEIRRASNNITIRIQDIGLIWGIETFYFDFDIIIFLKLKSGIFIFLL